MSIYPNYPKIFEDLPDNSAYSRIAELIMSNPPIGTLGVRVGGLKENVSLELLQVAATKVIEICAHKAPSFSEIEWWITTHAVFLNDCSNETKALLVMFYESMVKEFREEAKAVIEPLQNQIEGRMKERDETFPWSFEFEKKIKPQVEGVVAQVKLQPDCAIDIIFVIRDHLNSDFALTAQDAVFCHRLLDRIRDSF